MKKQKAAALPSSPVFLVDDRNWAEVGKRLSAPARAFAEANGFKPRSGTLLVLPSASGGIEAVLLGAGSNASLADAPFLAGKLATDLPAGRYHLAEADLADPSLAYLGFLLGRYRFGHYKTIEPRAVDLDAPQGCDRERVETIAEVVCAGRDLINTPANDMTPSGLAKAAHRLAKKHDAKYTEIIGNDLIKKNFPLIHAVGRAAAEPPRLIDLTWGPAKAPRVTLVGKGVVFDTGGLNLKPDSSMLLMRKDMGGAAAALTAAGIIMALGLRVRLRLLLPIVENSVSASAFRPGDIYPSRKGISVEIGNTDAEGRLVLADALALADEEKPDLLVDFATLTGAARVALGPDLPPFYTDDEALAAEVAAIGQAVNDPVWRMPLWKPYLSMLDSKYADMNNVTSGGFAGSVTAALFLKRFVTDAKSYVHFDIFGWTPSAKPGRPEGGEPQAARLIAELVARRFGSAAARD